MTASNSFYAAVSILLVAALQGEARAQPRTESAPGLTEGRVLAQSMCAECHAVQPGALVSPNPYAPSFETIANVRGMTSAALWSALHTSHRRMPNVILRPEETRAIVRYILTMQDEDD